MLALYFVYYNFCRVHQTLRVTPAMEAGITDHVWDVKDLVALLPTIGEQTTWTLQEEIVNPERWHNALLRDESE